MVTTLTSAYVIAAAVTALGALSTLLLSPRPHGWVGNLLSLARLGVFGGGIGAASRVLTEGGAVTLERVILMASLAVLYLLQVRAEVLRQRREGKA